MVRQGNGMPLRRLAAGLLALGVMLLSGCGSSKGTVSGTVKLKDGTPVSPGTTVIFWGADNAQYPGPVGANGAYSVPGLPTGELKVTVVPPPDSTHSITKSAPEKIVPIPAKYTDRTKSTLKHTVEKGKQDWDIVLE